MTEAAPALLQALEASGLGAAIRQSVWIYPAANVGHIVALVVFAVSVAVLDLAILGTFDGARLDRLIPAARRWTLGAFVAMAVTGFLLFTAEASHVALNVVFQVKAALIVAALTNALLVARPLSRALAVTRGAGRMPDRVRWAAIISLTLWTGVAASGRLIAYF